MSIKTINKLVEIVLMVNAFLVPVFFLPTTSEFFELNKLALVTVSTMILVVLWAIKLFQNKKVNVVKSPITGALFAFLAVFILATIFSMNPFVSMFGTYGRWFPSLYGLVTLVVFYFTVSSNVSSPITIRNTVLSLIAGIGVSSTYAVLSYAGVYLLRSDFAMTPNFNLAGSTTGVAVLAAIGVIMGLTYITSARNMNSKLGVVAATIPSIVVIFLYGEPSAYIIGALGLVLYLLRVNSERIAQEITFVAPLFGVALIMGVAVLTQSVAVLNNENFFKDINLDFETSWRISSATMTNYPLLGAGPGTFATNYSIYKPVTVNLTDVWNVRFDKPYNELLNILGALGLLGALAALYFGYKAAQYAFASRDEAVLSIGVLMSLAVYFVNYATVLNTFVLFLLLALLTSIKAEKTSLSVATLSTSMSLVPGLGESSTQKEVLHYFVILLMAIYIGVWGFYLYRDYSAEYYIRQSVIALQNEDGIAAYDYQALAIAANPQRSEYRNTFAQTNLAIANAIAGQEELTEENTLQIQTLVSQAIRETRISTEVLNPLLAGSWEVRARVYSALIGVAEDAPEWALGAYDSAIRLDPNNPRLRLEAGGIYFLQEDYLTAANLFRQAVNLKPDYANARYNLAQALKELENYSLAQRELQIVASLLPADSEDLTQVRKEIEELTPLIGDETPRPTIEDLEGQEQEPTEQEPLTNPGQINPVINQEVEIPGVNEQGEEQTTQPQDE